ncbi:MAG: CDP-alcohol phosphatidyltransferase family protein [Prevotella sp.]|jgi:CDP-diacylglycerol--serine O-phosphatidyltransferase|nr:CDP-alcohol phosphatidyltransferase family protein [Prevotella sp.]
MKKHIPNMITCCNLISGCIATYWAFCGVWDVALLFIVIGAVFDFFDGMSARLLGVSSPIGKELDSLADDITFGFAPSAIIFDFMKGGVEYLPWHYLIYIAFLMAAFSALRLAKFNLDERQSMGFIGLPTPANALFWGALLVGAGDWLLSSPYLYYAVVAGMLLSCWLLVSEVPMFALKFKSWGFKGNEIKYVFVLTSAVLIILFHIIGIAIVIAWYILLSILTNCFNNNK